MRLAFSTHPALWLAFCLGAGIAFAAHGPSLSLRTWGLFAAAVVISSLAVYVYGRRRLVSLRPLGFAALALVATALAGGLHYQAWEQQRTHHLAYTQPHLVDQRLTLQGRVQGAASSTPERTRFVLASDSIHLPGYALEVDGRVQVTVYSPEEGSRKVPVTVTRSPA